MTTMISLTIDGQLLEVEEGKTLLEAARGVGIDIPTMCTVDGVPHVASCMICVVADQQGRFVPACATRCQEGMVVATNSEAVRAARRTNLELMLSEHVGDCEGPCRVLCAAEMDIPLMMRQVENGDIESAITTVKTHIPFPSILGRICPAPCVKGCRSAQLDQPLSIQSMEAWLGDHDLASATPWRPPIPEKSGQRMAIVGAGAAGLAAAYFGLRLGHECVIFDDHAEAGGGLRYGIPDDKLPKTVVADDLEIVTTMGAELRCGIRVGRDCSWASIREEFDALLIACGEEARDELRSLGLELGDNGVVTRGSGVETNLPGVFAGGAAVRPGRIAVRSIAQGRAMAEAADCHLRGLEIDSGRRRPTSWIGRLSAEECENLRAERGLPMADGRAVIEDAEDAQKDARRCLHCECRKRNSCQLRDYSEEYDADQRRFRSRDRAPLTRVTHHDEIVFEPGKCIRCGVCVRLCEERGEELGLSFIGRGFELEIGVPFDRTLDQALTTSAGECVEHCPTAALSGRDDEAK